MHDFPPTIAGFDPARTREVTRPNVSSPTRFLFWILGQQRDVLLVGGGLAVLWFLPGTLGPFLVGRAVDRGITAGSTPGLLFWAGLLLAVIVIAGIFGVLGHTVIVRGWLIALFRTTMLVNRKGTQLGHVLPQRTPTGEVLSVASGRRRSVRRADRNHLPGDRIDRRLPGDRPDRVVDLGAARTDRADRRADPGAGLDAPAAADAPQSGAGTRSELDADLAGHRHRRRAADPAWGRR